MSYIFFSLLFNLSNSMRSNMTYFLTTEIQISFDRLFSQSCVYPHSVFMTITNKVVSNKPILHKIRPEVGNRSLVSYCFFPLALLSGSSKIFDH